MQQMPIPSPNIPQHLPLYFMRLSKQLSLLPEDPLCPLQLILPTQGEKAKPQRMDILLGAICHPWLMKVAG